MHFANHVCKYADYINMFLMHGVFKTIKDVGLILHSLRGTCYHLE